MPIGTRIELAQQMLGRWAGGTTNRIYAYPSDPEPLIADAQFWFGTAAIHHAAEYSFFPERVRIQIPIMGHGIRLHFREPTEIVALDTYTPYRFDGARPVRVELVEGPIVALNLIFHHRVRAEAQVLQFNQQRQRLPDLIRHIMPGDSAANHTIVRIVYVITGSVAICHANEPRLILKQGDAFVVHPYRAEEHSVLLLEQCEPAVLVAAEVWLP